MTIKFLDLQAQYRSIKDEINEAVLKTLDSAAYVLGPEVEAFENEFAAAHNAQYGVAVNTGTSALHLALLAAGVGPGDEVITVSMTFTATAAAISYCGATPVFVDVDPASMTMDPSQVEARITPKTKAILPVHLYGQAADMDPLMDIATRHNLPLIEDAAQAHLAQYNGTPVGGIGAVGCFSFYPGKNLGAYGEGGMAITNDPELAKRMKLYRDWGQTKKYHHEMVAYNYRMDGIQGTILRVKLRYLDKWTEARREHAAQYQDLFGDAIQHSRALPNRKHVFHIFGVFHDERDRLQAWLNERSVQTGIHYPIPVHLQQAYASLGHKVGDFPATEAIASRQLSLPMFAELTGDEIEQVVEHVLAFS